MGKRKGRKTEKWKEEGKRGEGKGNRTGIGKDEEELVKERGRERSKKGMRKGKGKRTEKGKTESKGSRANENRKESINRERGRERKG